MNDKESFDLAKGIFEGMDLSTEIGYQNACNNIQNSNMEPWQKDMVISKLYCEYIHRKNIVERGKRATDFVEQIYNLFNNNK